MCSHISLEICSRTVRAFSRAAARQAVLIERSEKFVLFQRTDDRVPLLLSVRIARVFEIEEQLQIYVGDAGIIFRALDVAAHPEKGISDATKHMTRE